MSDMKITLKDSGEGSSIYYDSGFSDHEAEILCIAIDSFGSGQHPCASPGNNGGLWDDAKEHRGVGLRSFGAEYIIEVCEKASWPKYATHVPDSATDHPYTSSDNNLNPKVVMESAITRLKAALTGPYNPTL